MGKKIALFAFCVLSIAFALIGCGGGGGGGDTGNPVGPVVSGPVANLSGTVKLSGKPLANVTVGLYKPEKAILAGASGMASLRGSVLAQTKLAEGSYSTKTDSDGRYSFTAVPVGEYTLIAGKGEPYQFARTGVILGSVTEQDAQLTPTGKVFGRLLLSGGQPVRGAWVYLAGTSYVSISDASGNFTINHVPSGQNFTLDILSTDGGTLQTPVNTINIGPAENKSLGDLTLAVPVVPVQPASVINGQVNVADSSVPASALNALMVVVSSGDNLPLIAYTDSSGKFSLNVKTAGSYKVSVVGGEFAVAPTVQTVAISALGTTVSVPQPFVLSKPTVVLPPTTQFYTYSGTINKRSKAFNEPDNAGVPLTLTSTDAAANVFSAVTSPTGLFTFSIPAGTYNLAVGGGYALETTFANPLSISASTVLNNVIWVVPTQVFTANFIVSGSLTKVTRVNGETDESNVIVTLTPTTGDAVTFAGATTPTGSFAIRVPAGTYNLAVTGAYKFETVFANPITVSAATNVGNGLRLIPANPAPASYVVSGTALKSVFVNGDTGHASVTISLASAAGPASTYTGQTDASGNYSITVPAGTYNMSVISSSYRPAGALAQVTVTSSNVTVPSFNLLPIQAPVVLSTVSGSINKLDYIVGETDNGGVIITLTNNDASAKLYSTVTTFGGAFTFKVEPGTYTLAINSGYKFATTFSNPVDASVGNVSISPAIDIVPLATKMFTLSGDINKVVRKAGESNDGDVTVTIRSDSATFMPQTAVTEVSGNFAFKVPAGNYAIEVSSGYVFVTPPSGFPYVVSAADLAIAPIDVRPAGVVPASIGGSVTPASPNKHYRVRIEKTAGSYTDNETTEGAFYFNNLAPGEYKIVVLPDANGYYGESALLNVAEGENLTGVSLAPTLVVPLISDIFAPENVLTVSGSNLASDTAAPPSGTAVPGDTKILVDGNLCDRPAGFTLTPAQDQATIGSIAPGKHNFVVERLWHRPNTTETFILKSSPVSFNKIMGAPANVAVNDVTDVGAKISWTNANFTSKSVVNVIKVSDNSQVASVVLDGTSFQVTGLLASTSYVAHVYNRFGDVESTPTSVNFTTRSNIDYGIASTTLAGSELISPSDIIFGFEVMNGKTYVARYSPSGGIFITAYNADGSQYGSVYSIAETPIASPGSLSLTSGDNYLYLTHRGTGAYNNLLRLSPDLANASTTIVTDVSTFTYAHADYANGKLFVTGCVPGDVGVDQYLYLYTTPATELNTRVELASYSSSSVTASPIRICHDDKNLYWGRISPSGLMVERLPLSITAPMPQNIVKDFSMAGSSFDINQFAFGGNNVYAKVWTGDYWEDFYIDRNSGYARKEEGDKRGIYAADSKGRIWMAESNFGKSYIQLTADGRVEKNLDVYEFPNYTSSYPNPGAAAKVDSMTGSFNMLYRYYDGNFTYLKVFNYPASY